ncbi:MAG: hypothetical protein J5985_00075 [Kiritimatiellae bacterium]|nr:hypothetical protein [Kiritimatiellia bacterium]
MVDWNIRPRGRSCSVCGKPFEDKQPCVSALKEVEGGGFERVDCCAACWKQTPREWQPFSLWEGEFEAPPPAEAKVEPVKKETAEDLLRKLLLLDDPSMRNVAYVLAVMLERGKQIVERDVKTLEDGSLLRIYEHRKSGDSFLVVDPRLRLDQLGDVQRQVIELLSGTHTLEAAAPETNPPPSEASPNQPPPES